MAQRATCQTLHLVRRRICVVFGDGKSSLIISCDLIVLVPFECVTDGNLYDKKIT